MKHICSFILDNMLDPSAKPAGTRRRVIEANNPNNNNSTSFGSN